MAPSGSSEKGLSLHRNKAKLKSDGANIHIMHCYACMLIILIINGIYHVRINYVNYVGILCVCLYHCIYDYPLLICVYIIY